MDWPDYKQQIKKTLDAANFPAAEKLLLEALAFLKQNQHSAERLCLCLDQLGFVFVNQKNFQRAEQCYKESMELKKTSLGSENPIVARACKKIATVVYLQQKFDLAEKYSKEALHIFKTTLGPDNPETQQTIEDLVALLRKIGRHVEADIMQKQARPAAGAGGEKDYQASQSLFDIKICPTCSFPYDGKVCIRCSDTTVE